MVTCAKGASFGEMVATNVTVYQFKYFDRATKSMKVARDFATESAVKAMGATLLRETGQSVPPGEVTTSGIWRPYRSRP